MIIWLTILGMALATYATRVSTMLALRGEIAPWLRRWLGYVPIAVYSAFIVPPLLLQTRADTRSLAIGPALPAGLVGALVAWRSGNVVLTILTGMLTFWLLRWLGM
jgi:branched chain amino acid efflux pump